MVIKILEVIIWIVGLWLIFCFFIPLLILPNHLLFKTKIQKTEKIKKVARRLKGKSKEQTLRNVYNYVIKNYKGIEQRLLVANIPKLFLYDVERLLEKKQFLACHIQNLITITLLINTEQFKETNFKRKETITPFLTLHQYMIITLDGQRFKADPFMKIFEKI